MTNVGRVDNRLAFILESIATLNWGLRVTLTKTTRKTPMDYVLFSLE